VLVLVNNPVYSWKPRPACDGIHIVITIIDINGNICTGASHKNIQFRYTSFQDYVSPVLLLLAIMLSVLLQYTYSDYLFGIFKLFLN
jgi:phage-related holin